MLWEKVMHFLLTGGTGLIGTHLGRELVMRGHQITLLTRREMEKPPFPANCVVWDFQKPLSITEQFDGVINLAGENVATKRWTERRRAELRSSRVDLTEKLVTALQQSPTKPKLWVNASAVGYYGEDTDGAPVDETAGPGEGFLAELCQEWEAASKPVEDWGTRRILLRFGLVLAKEDGFLAKILPLFQAGLGGPLGDGEQHMSWIHIEDLVRIFFTIIESPSLTGPINAVAPQTPSNKEFTQALAKALGKKAFLPVPQFALELVKGKGSASLAFSDQIVRPKILQDAHFSWKYPTCDIALRNLVQ